MIPKKKVLASAIMFEIACRTGFEELPPVLNEPFKGKRRKKGKAKKDWHK